jgi:hypothetical protein
MKEAVNIFENFLLPSYTRSEKFKQRINTFSVILRSQNIHLTDIKNKIDKYSEKFITLLENILFNELKHYMITALPKASSNRNKSYCQKRHIEILNSMVIADDDSCLSGLEDEIMISCQRGAQIEIALKKTQTIIKEEMVVEENKPPKYDKIEEFKEFTETSQTNDIFKPIQCSVDKMEVDEMKPITMYAKPFKPEIDPSSNFNAYKRKFVPPINKNKERLKDSVPFLKEFNPKFLKKENIDKKILRKFRNYVKSICKHNPDQITNYDTFFWNKFAHFNLLPPMKYIDKNTEVEFKSFNIKYMIWLFSKNGTIELYREFSREQGMNLLQSFIDAYDLLNNKEEIDIIPQLKRYIHELPDIYSSSKPFTENKSVYSITTELQSEDILDNYIGEFRNDSQIFRLNNFETFAYPRCGKNYVNDFCESVISYDMNVSMDSIQSAE